MKNNYGIHRYGSYFTLRFINPIIRVMTISDLVILGGFGLIAPIFAIFITDSIQGGTVAVVGISQAVFLLAKSIFQIPAAIVMDAVKGEKDDFWAMLTGSILYSAVPVLYLLVDTPLGLYIVQFVYGLSAAVVQPAWNAIWMRHIDRGHEGVESGVYFTMIGLASALTAMLGGYLAETVGFAVLFYIVSVVSLIGSMFLTIVYKRLRLRPRAITHRHGQAQ
jgi:hypothetical protein